MSKQKKITISMNKQRKANQSNTKTEVIAYGRPDYAKLKCPECGNIQYFIEDAVRPTSQRFTASDKPSSDNQDWDIFEWCDGVYVLEIRCEGAVKNGDVCGATVWKAETT